MPKLYYRLPNGNSFAHVSRSGTSTLAAHVLKKFYPEKYELWMREDNHSPQWYLDEFWANRLPINCLVMVRNPVDRLKSLIARNQYKESTIKFALEYAERYAITSRYNTRNLSIVTMHHLMPVDYIAENDSHFVKFPRIKQACEYLDLTYDSSICVNKQKNVVRDLPDYLKNKLKDSLGIWEALA